MLHDNVEFARQTGLLIRGTTRHGRAPSAGSGGMEHSASQGGHRIAHRKQFPTIARSRSVILRIVFAATVLVTVAKTHDAFAQGSTTPAATNAPSAAAPAATPAAPAPTDASPAAAPAPAAGATTGDAAGAAPPAPSMAGPLPGEHQVSRAELPQDLSPWGMFEAADDLVKAVMIGLAFASLVTWTVWLAKTYELHVARRQVRQDLGILNSAATFAQAHEQLRNGTSPVAQLMQAAAQEIRVSANLRSDGLKERIALQLERIEAAVTRKVARGTGVLATIGSTAPFVGLFGTVWGIMNSFIGISNAHTTNLAVVAPGIAQALLATALGLVAAIPAVMIYNVLARSTAHYRALLGDGSAGVMRLVSRDLDRAKMPMPQAAE
jgi:biopolymer transport protein ExbB